MGKSDEGSGWKRGGGLARGMESGHYGTVMEEERAQGGQKHVEGYYVVVGGIEIISEGGSTESADVERRVDL